MLSPDTHDAYHPFGPIAVPPTPKAFAVIESPFSATSLKDVQRNIAYARAVCREFTNRGYAVYASHLLFPQWMADADDSARAAAMRSGMETSLALLRTPGAVHVFAVDYGRSKGMREAASHTPLGARCLDFRFGRVIEPQMAGLYPTAAEAAPHVRKP